MGRSCIRRLFGNNSKSSRIYYFDMSNNLLMKPKKSKKPSSKKSVQGLHSIIPPFVDKEEDDQELLDSLMTNPDPGACPNCGGDLDDGDHTYCSRF